MYCASDNKQYRTCRSHSIPLVEDVAYPMYRFPRYLEETVVGNVAGAAKFPALRYFAHLPDTWPYLSETHLVRGTYFPDRLRSYKN